MCNTSVCIPRSKVCDLEVDCLNGDDEDDKLCGEKTTYLRFLNSDKIISTVCQNILREYHIYYRPAKSSDKAEDLLLLGIFFKSSAFPVYLEILQLFPNFTGHSKYNR